MSKKRKRFEAAIASLQTRYGPDIVRRGTATSRAIAHISTGFPDLDSATGIGGIPIGRLTVLAGAITSGKLTVAARILAHAQRHRRGSCPVAYLDLARNVSPDYLYRCGVDLQRLLVVRPHNAREAATLCLELIQSHQFCALLVDDVALYEQPAEQRLWASALNRLSVTVANGNSAVLFLQERPGFWRRWLPWLNGPAQRALSHYAALCIELQRERWIQQGRNICGYQTQARITKNKLAPAGKEAQIHIRINGTIQGDGLL